MYVQYTARISACMPACMSNRRINMQNLNQQIRYPSRFSSNHENCVEMDRPRAKLPNPLHNPCLTRTMTGHSSCIAVRWGARSFAQSGTNNNPSQKWGSQNVVLETPVQCSGVPCIIVAHFIHSMRARILTQATAVPRTCDGYDPKYGVSALDYLPSIFSP